MNNYLLLTFHNFFVSTYMLLLFPCSTLCYRHFQKVSCFPVIIAILVECVGNSSLKISNQNLNVQYMLLLVVMNLFSCQQLTNICISLATDAAMQHLLCAIWNLYNQKQSQVYLNYLNYFSWFTIRYLNYFASFAALSLIKVYI